jgi:uncharacterized protein YbaR (Trm112 family)
VLESALLNILACPIDKGALLYLPDEAMLYNPRLRRAYLIEQGVPVLLARAAVPVSADQHEHILGRVIRGEVAATGGLAAQEVAAHKS